MSWYDNCSLYSSYLQSMLYLDHRSPYFPFSSASDGWLSTNWSRQPVATSQPLNGDPIRGIFPGPLVSVMSVANIFFSIGYLFQLCRRYWNNLHALSPRSTCQSQSHAIWPEFDQPMFYILTHVTSCRYQHHDAVPVFSTSCQVHLGTPHNLDRPSSGRN